jgi:hypothetical protein
METQGEVAVVTWGRVAEELGITTTLCGRRGVGCCMEQLSFAVGEDTADVRIGTELELGMRGLRGTCCWGLLPVLVVGADGVGGVIATEAAML